MNYLIRLDDITEGTNWKYFSQLEKVFDKYNIKPILGVVPENKDNGIMDANYLISREDFLKKVKKLQEKNYVIAMHGVNHLLKKTNKKSITKINNYGELVDLSYQEKSIKLQYGKQVLQDKNINVDMYMPPAHWIDEDTIKILKELDFLYITDGLFAYPKKIHNIWFIPQQIWRPRQMNIPGIYTICLHINTMNDKSIDRVVGFIENNHNRFVSMNNIKFESSFIIDIYNFVIGKLFSGYLGVRRLLK